MSAISTSTTPALDRLIDLEGRTVVVTGAAHVADELEAGRARSALAVRTDVSDEAQVDHVVAAAAERFGSVDILVNNAGIHPQVPFLEIDLASFRRVLDVNLVGVFLCTRAAARRMIAQGHGAHRMGDPDDIARAALFLASDLASYVTGSQLVVDGGKLLT